MFFGLMHRAARGLRAGPASREGVLPLVAARRGRALAALGAVPLADRLRDDGVEAPLRAVFEGTPAPTTGLLAVAVSAHVAHGTAQLWLADSEGTVFDRAALAPSARPAMAWLFAPPTVQLQVHIQPAAPAGEAFLVAARAWALPEANLAPDRLTPTARIAADAQWSRAYGTVPAADAPGRLREHVFASLARPTLVPVLKTMRLWLEPGDELSRAVFLSGVYEPSLLLAMRALLPAGGVFVDVGAHCGFVTAFGAERVGKGGRVIAFEPSPREFTRLEANIAAGALARVETRQMAVADAPGTLTLRLAEAGHAGHNTVGERFAYEGVKVEALVEVAATTLDAALAGLDRCDLIKMDIEGAELRALRGGAAALARLRPALILEVFDRSLAGCGDTEAAVLAWLDAAGYDAREIDLATGTFKASARAAPGESRNIVALPRR